MVTINKNAQVHLQSGSRFDRLPCEEVARFYRVPISISRNEAVRKLDLKRDCLIRY
jgi:hypothetical protein